jgi:hypothetical protein
LRADNSLGIEIWVHSTTRLALLAQYDGVDTMPLGRLSPLILFRQHVNAVVSLNSGSADDSSSVLEVFASGCTLFAVLPVSLGFMPASAQGLNFTLNINSPQTPPNFRAQMLLVPRLATYDQDSNRRAANYSITSSLDNSGSSVESFDYNPLSRYYSASSSVNALVTLVSSHADLAGSDNTDLHLFPSNQTLGQLTDFRRIIDDRTTWFFQDSTEQARIARFSLCASSLSNNVIHMNGTFNGQNDIHSCSLQFSSIGTLTDAALAFSQQFAECDFPIVAITSHTDETNSCGYINFIPTIGSGLWRCSISWSDDDSFEWQARQSPATSDFIDMSPLCQRLFGQNCEVDASTVMPVSELGITPVDFQSVLPEFTSVTTLSLNMTFEEVIPPAFFFNTTLMVDNNSSFVLAYSNPQLTDHSAIVAHSFFAKLHFISDMPPTILNLQLFTNLSNVSVNDPVPAAPNNTFTFSFGYFNHSSLTSKPLVQKLDVELVPGQPLMAALQSAFAANSFVSISLDPGLESLGTTDEIQFLVPNAFQDSFGSWIEAVFIQFSDSKIFAISGARFEPSRQRARVHTPSFVSSYHFSLVAPIEASTGQIGILSSTFSDASARISQHSTSLLQITNASIPLNEFAGAAVSQSIDYFFSVFAQNLSVSNQVDLLCSVATMSPFALSLRTEGACALIQSPSEQSVCAQQLAPRVIYDQSGALMRSANDPPADGSQWSLLRPRDAFLTWFARLDDVFSAVLASTAANTKLPLFGFSLSQAFNSSLVPRLTDLFQKVKEVQAVLSWEQVCSVIGDFFGSDETCRLLPIVDSLHLSLEINVVANTSLNTNMNFPTNQFNLGGTLPTLPIGVGTQGALQIDVVASAMFKLEADLSTNPPTLSIGASSRINVAASLDSETSIELQIGSLTAELANARSILSASLTVEQVGGGFASTENVPTLASDKSVYAVVRSHGLEDDLAFSTFQSPLVLISTTFTGMAQVNATLSLMGSPLCRFSLTAQFADPPIWAQQDCYGGFARVLMAKLADNPFFQFVLDGKWLSQFQNPIKAFGRLFSIGRLAVRVPIIGKVLTQLSGGSIDQLDQFFATEFATLLRTTAYDYLKDPSVPIDIERRLIDRISELLCNSRDINGCTLSCIRVDTNASTLRQWDMKFDCTKTKPLNSFELGMGSSSPSKPRMAAFSFSNPNNDCGLVFAAVFKFSITQTPGRGFDIKFSETDPVFQASASANFATCSLQGALVFLMAQMDLSGSLGVDFQVLRTGGNWDFLLSLSSQFTNPARLGFNMVQGPKYLPYYRTTMSFNYLCTNRNCSQAPTISFTDSSICVGAMISNIMNRIMQKLQDIVKPLDPIIGPNAFLRKEMTPSCFLFGKCMNNAQFIIRVAGMYGLGNAKDLEKILDFYMELAKFYDQIRSLQSVDDCGIRWPLRSFSSNMNEPNPQPVFQGMTALADTLEFNENVSQSVRVTSAGIFTSISRRTGSFGLILNIRENPEANLIKLILGDNIDIFTVTWPTVGVSFNFRSWPLVVWVPPVVSLSFSFDINFQLAVPPLIYNTNGIQVFQKTRRFEALILSGLYFPVYNPNGSPRTILSATFRLSGGVTVSVLIFKGGASVFAQLDTGLNMNDVNGDGRIYLDTIRRLFSKNKGIYVFVCLLAYLSIIY